MFSVDKLCCLWFQRLPLWPTLVYFCQHISACEYSHEFFLDNFRYLCWAWNPLAITVPTLVLQMLARVLLMYARTVPGCLWITCGYPVDNFGAGEGGLLVLIIVVPTPACKRVNLTKNSKKRGTFNSC